ncbi:MAG: MBL fold metallo-hydrolase [Planctomycetes bacterium]|nr:MBL fold metallo-hydrolase [Planctomycetota bacterium]
MKLKFWGTRGSIPSPGPDTVRHGGNTPCVEVRCDGTLLIFDAGTGLRVLGNHLLRASRGQPIKAHLLISHFHWDHIQGFPFFVPAYIPGNHLTIYGSEGITQNLEALLAGQMAADYFPVELREMASTREFHSLSEEEFFIEGIRVRTRFVNHPGMALCYRVDHGGRSFCYVSDNEPQYYLIRHSEDNGAISKRLMMDIAGGRLGLSNMDDGLVSFIRDVDVLIHDCQYTPEEYSRKVGWGHSFYHFPVEVALQANVRSLLLFHHDPTHDDAQVDRIVESCREVVRARSRSLECRAASEGMEMDV